MQLYPEGVGPGAAAQILHLTPLPRGGLDGVDLGFSIPRAGTMILAHILGDDALRMTRYSFTVWN